MNAATKKEYKPSSNPSKQQKEDSTGKNK